MKTQMFRLFSFSLFFTLLLSGSVRLATAQSGQPPEQIERIEPASPSPENASGLPAQKAADETLMISEWISDTYQVFMPCISTSCGPLFADNFSDPGSGWLIENYTEYSTAYLNGEYQILVKAPNYIAWNWLDFGASDYRVVVDARPAGQLDGSVGLVFGGTNSGFYLFQLSNGGYGLWRIEWSSWIWTTLINWTNSPAVHSGSLTNRLEVVRKGASIELYANDQLLTTISHSTYTGSLLGVAAATVPANFDGRFDNFTVYTGACIDMPTAGLAPVRSGSFVNNGITYGASGTNPITPGPSRTSK
jgi:hypothetical protein